MSKFVIECPNCGRFAEASTGFFAKKKINCKCGYVIDIKTDKMASKVCPHCGNTVVYDQSKNEEAVCPVCRKKINTSENKKALAVFSCPTCGCKISADKNSVKYTCPLCDTVVDVQKQNAKEEVKNQGVVSVIKYEGGNDTFVWKHPIEDYNLGSQLIVHESQEAVFFRDGKALDLFGAGRYTISTQNVPLLENLYKLPTNSTEVFHSEVYFINLTTQMGIKWGTDSKVRLFDPASGIPIEIGACGNFSLRVCDSRKLLLRLIGTVSEFKQNEVIGDSYSTSSVVGKFKALVMNRVKSNLSRIIRENGINILEIDEYIDIISEKLRTSINEVLIEYGLTMPEFFVTSVITPDDDPNYRRLKQQFADKTLRVREENIRKEEAEASQRRKLVEVQGEAQLKMVGAQAEAEVLKIKTQAEAEAHKAKAFAEADAYKAKALAEAEEMHSKGYTYQQETARMVGMEAMQNGITGNGSGGSGIAVGDIAGLGVTLGAMGGVIGMTKDALSPIMQTSSEIGSTVIPHSNDSWDCKCGCKNIKSNFCPDCGSPRQETIIGWDCSCGKKNITSKFCPDCGKKRPEPDIWDCPECGYKNITSKFCPNCGHRKEG